MPPSTHITDPAVRRSKVTIHLSDVDRIEDISDRFIILESPTWSAEIGRGSMTDGNIIPKPDNAWYTSKVMSRVHAKLTADPVNKHLYIEDCNSMHGTYLDGKRVGALRQMLISEDVVTFGTKVQRGNDSFEPLKTAVHFEWSDGNTSNKVSRPINRYTADYSDSDSDSDLSYDGTGYDNNNFHKGKIEPMSGKRGRSPSVEIIAEVPTKPRLQASIDLTQDDYRPSIGFKSPVIHNPTNLETGDTLRTCSFDQDNVPGSHRKEKVQEKLLFPEPFPAIVAEVNQDSFDDDGAFDDDDLDQALVNLSDEDWRPSSSEMPVQTLQEVPPSSPVQGSQRDPSPSDAALAKPSPSWKDSPAVKKITTDRNHEGQALPRLPEPTENHYFPALPPLNLESRVPSTALCAEPMVPISASTLHKMVTTGTAQAKSKTPPFDALAPVQLPTSDSAPADRKRKYDEILANDQDEYESEVDDEDNSEGELPDHFLHTYIGELEGELLRDIPSDHNVTTDKDDLHSSQVPAQAEKAAIDNNMTVQTASQLERVSLEPERPRKKARLGATLAKGAGLILTGVAAGVVGTVVTLANLPPDFFA